MVRNRATKGESALFRIKVLPCTPSGVKQGNDEDDHGDGDDYEDDFVLTTYHAIQLADAKALLHYSNQIKTVFCSLPPPPFPLAFPQGVENQGQVRIPVRSNLSSFYARGFVPETKNARTIDHDDNDDGVGFGDNDGVGDDSVFI